MGLIIGYFLVFIVLVPNYLQLQEAISSMREHLITEELKKVCMANEQNEQIVKECFNSKINFLDYSCFERVAVTKKDKSICSNIPNLPDISVEEHKKMIDMCVERVEIATADEQFLNRADFLSPGRFFPKDFALKSVNGIDCKKYTESSLSKKDTDYKNLAKTWSNESYCERIKDEIIRDECFYDIFSMTGRSWLCEKIKRESLRDECFYNILTSQGIGFMDGVYICDKMSSNNYKKQCQEFLKK